MRTDDQSDASALTAYRAVLAAAAGDRWVGRPWQQPGQPPDDTELVRLAAWRASDPGVDADVVIAGLGLIGAARSELDQVEAGLLFAARTAGVTYQKIAAAMGLGSGQAAQQRMSRVTARLDGTS